MMASVEEQAMAGTKDEKDLKKNSSYRYWVRGNLTGAAPKPVPQKLTPAEVAGNGNVNSAAVGSMWNRAGTWEEKVLSSWAGSRVKELLRTVEPVEFEEGMAKVTEVTNCSGDASLVTVRQRKRIGYSFEIEMKYAINMKQGAQKEAIEGKMKVPEACYGELDDLELEISISPSDVTDSAQRKRVTQMMSKLLLPKIRRKLEEFEAELKER